MELTFGAGSGILPALGEQRLEASHGRPTLATSAELLRQSVKKLHLVAEALNREHAVMERALNAKAAAEANVAALERTVALLTPEKRSKRQSDVPGFFSEQAEAALTPRKAGGDAAPDMPSDSKATPTPTPEQAPHHAAVRAKIDETQAMKEELAQAMSCSQEFLSTADKLLQRATGFSAGEPGPSLGPRSVGGVEDAAEGMATAGLASTALLATQVSFAWGARESEAKMANRTQENLLLAQRARELEQECFRFALGPVGRWPLGNPCAAATC
mmetsp:Transcript_57917/g.161630  ORF Transcript_57917/g.161630 Transcript_57917/m.161630 type:complete len:273 (-) Transcript_57917:98-916(-)